MKHVAGLPNSAGARTTSIALARVQAERSGVTDNEQTRIKAINIGPAPVCSTVEQTGAGPMLMALILVCSLSVTPDLSACTRANAIDVVRAPAEFGNPATCFMHGQAYLAETEMG